MQIPRDEDGRQRKVTTWTLEHRRIAIQSYHDSLVGHKHDVISILSRARKVQGSMCVLFRRC